MKKWTQKNRQLQKIRQAAYDRKRVPGGGGRKRKYVNLHSNELRHLTGMARHKRRLKAFKQADVTYTVPSRFSLIDNPIESLRFIAKVGKSINDREIKAILLDHSKLSDHDLAAEILLGVAAREVQLKSDYRNIKIKFRGLYPSSERQTRLIRSMGVVRKLKIETDSEAGDLSNIEIFDFKGQKDEITKSGEIDRKNRCAKLFVDHVNKCLSHTMRKLTDKSVQALVGFLGEIIGNSEDHSGENGWYVCGYLDDSTTTALDGKELRFCEIVIYNFGKSIADTFEELDPGSYAMSLVSPYVNYHLKKGFFDPKWHIDDLLTLVALQSHISCKNSDPECDRGQGTVDLIEFFQRVASECSNLGEENARMALISGRTHILFDYKYRISRDQSGREIIAFNAENDLNVKPDGKYVTHMEGARFPGTLIGIKFPLKTTDTEIVPPEAVDKNEKSS